MAKYLVNRPTFINGVYREASVQNPITVELDKSIEPSRTFEPLDKEAQDCLAKLNGPDGKPVKKQIRSAPPAAVAAKPAKAETVPDDDKL